MKRGFWLAAGACLLVVSGLCGCSRSPINQTTAVAETTHAKLQGGERSERDGWVYVHLEGSPDRIGYQHGALLAKEIDDLLRVMKPMMTHSGKYDWNFFRNAAEKVFWPKTEKEYQDEIDGIVAGATAKGVKI